MSSPETTWTAIVLAAGRGPDDPFAGAFGVSHKCLIEVAGTPMLARVCAALRAAEEIGDIVISIDAPQLLETASGFETLLADERVKIVQSAQRPADSVEAAITASHHRFPYLVTTADHALLTPAMVSHFCRHSGTGNADVTAGIAMGEMIRKAYPDAIRTFIRFADGDVSGCNMYALMDPRARAAVRFWRHIDRERKSPLRFVRAFGPVALFKYLTGRLTLDDGFARASHLIGVSATAIDMPFAEAAIDVDKPADLDLAEAILKTREAH